MKIRRVVILLLPLALAACSAANTQMNLGGDTLTPPTNDDGINADLGESTSLHDETWVRIFEGPDYGAFFDMLLTTENTILLVGATNHLHQPPYSGDVLIMELSLAGEMLREQIWGGEGYEQAWGLTTAQEGGYYVFGETNSFGAGDRDFFLLKIDGRWEQEWYQTYGREHREWPFGMLPLANGDLLLYGYSEDPASGRQEQYAVRVAASGEVIWEYFGDAVEDELVEDVVENTDGSLVMAVVVGEDGKLVKLNPDGNLRWSQRYELPGWQFASRVAPSDDGGYFLAGFFMDSSAGYQADTWLAQADADGNLIWQSSFGEPAFDDYGQALIRLNDGSFLIGGLGNGFLLSCVDQDGALLWRRSLIGDEVYAVEAIIELEDGGFLAAGMLQLINGRSYDPVILRTDQNGMVGSD